MHNAQIVVNASCMGVCDDMPEGKNPDARLRQARAAAGFQSARQAALAFGWPEATYAQHENGTRGVRADTAQKYAAAFEVSPGWIMHGEGNGPGATNRSDRNTFQESEVAPFQSATAPHRAALRHVAKLLQPHSQHDALFLAAQARPDLYIMRGDVLILDTTSQTQNGDTVVVQIFSESGEADTELRRLVGNTLIGRPGTARELIDRHSNDASIRGRVVGLVRGLDFG
jgi:SOS-response transcriptional repressor LexA